MEKQFAQLSIKGKIHQVPATTVEGHTVVVRNGWLKIASIKSEELQPGHVENPAAIIQALRQQPLKADIFTFVQKLPYTQPKFDYPVVWDNVAAIQLSTFDAWLEDLSQDTRRNIRLASKRGLVVQPVPFSDELARGIVEIYNETPVRNGRRFWHYGKDFETVKRENSTYPERSQFIAAYSDSELVGFFKMVFVNNVASVLQILSKNSHKDKRPMNAMISKAVEICCAMGKSHLVYSKYIYGTFDSSSLTEFKRRNGFEQILLPRYFVPLTLKGRTAMRFRLHLGIKELLPKGLTTFLLNLRKAYLEHSVRDRRLAERGTST